MEYYHGNVLIEGLNAREERDGVKITSPWKVKVRFRLEHLLSSMLCSGRVCPHDCPFGGSLIFSLVVNDALVDSTGRWSTTMVTC